MVSERRNAHPYHMYDAIQEQPARVAQLLETQRATLERAATVAARATRIVYAGIGSSYHAAQIGEHFLRHLTAGRAAALVEQSFELVHYPLALGPDDFVILISHRGWKNYSVEALKKARAAGARTMAVTGEGGGEGIRAADFVVMTCAQEISFAHTKSYTSALAALALFAIGVAERRVLASDAATARALLEQVPQWMRQALGCEAKVRVAAKDAAARQRLVFIGAGSNWATAREGALKVKETSYVAADGFETEQFLHGPISEMDSCAAAVGLFTASAADARLVSALEALGELRVLRIALAPASAPGGIPAEHIVEVPAAPEWLSPFVQTVPVQLLSYFLALERSTHPDTGREHEPAHARAHKKYTL
jgi:glucosamine--fructose-6-phosphate aminotransferase (isomerizing)